MPVLDPNIGRIQFHRSTTPGAKPTGLALGEIAVNLADRTLYSSDGTNIIDIGFGLGGNVKGSIGATGDITSQSSMSASGNITTTNFGVLGQEGDGRGISLYNGVNNYYDGMPAYGISFAKSEKFGGHGAVTTGGVWATYFTTGGGANRGWIFKDSVSGNPKAGNVASISNSGIATFARVDAPLNGNASTATRLETTRKINTVDFDGTRDISAPGFKSVIAVDERAVKPVGTPKAAASFYFSTQGGMTGVQDLAYGDLMVLNNFADPSGGLVTGMFFPKSQGANPIVYQAAQGASSWGVGKQLAFLGDNVKSADKFKFSTSISTGINAQWYRIGKGTIPQMGTVVEFEITGGAGFNSQTQQMTPTKLIVKTGNGNPAGGAGIKMIVVDGNNSPINACVRHIGNNMQEVWVNLGPYFTAYVNVIMPDSVTDWVNEWTPMGSADPTGAYFAFNETLARTTSNVATATSLQTARNINGVPFDGTRDIRIQTSSVRIASGSLDDVIAEGNYYCDFDSDALNIANKPMAGSFALEVLRTAGVIQRFTNYNTGRTFIRKSYGSFGAWGEIALLTQANTWTKTQTIDSGGVSYIQMNGTEEAAVVLQKPNRRAVLTIPADNSVGLLVDGSWIFNSPAADTLNLHANTAVLNGKLFRLQGAERDNIDRVQNGNAAITINSPEPGMASIRNALDFGWYDDHFQLGAIRSGSQASHGFGITKGNNDLLWRVTPQGDMFSKGAVIAGAYLSATGDSTSQKVISRSGRFASADNFHYIDVGQNGRDLMTFAEYGAAFEFINTSNQQPILSVNPTGGATLVANAGYAANVNDSVQSNLVLLGRGSGAALRTNVGLKPSGWNVGYKPVVHAALQSDQGYVTNVSIGAYKASNDWSDAGAYIAVGGSDASPTEAFWFSLSGNIKSTIGRIRFPQPVDVNNDLYVNNNLTLGGAIRSEATSVQFLTTNGQARKIATGGVLCSSSYADLPNVADGGIWAQNRISGQELVSRTFVDAVYAQFASGVNITQASGGGTSNGIRAGNGDAALYSTCNLDIQTHNGLGIKDNTGVRRIVFDARQGIIHCQGPLNSSGVNSASTITAVGGITSNDFVAAPVFRGKVTEVVVGNNANTGAKIAATWRGAAMYDTRVRVNYLASNTVSFDINLKSLGKYIEPGKTKVYLNYPGIGLVGLVISAISKPPTGSSSKICSINAIWNGHPLSPGAGTSNVPVFGLEYDAKGCQFGGIWDGYGWNYRINLDSPCTNLPHATATAAPDNWTWYGSDVLPTPTAPIIINASPFDTRTVAFSTVNGNSGNTIAEHVSIQVWDVV